MTLLEVRQQIEAAPEYQPSYPEPNLTVLAEGKRPAPKLRTETFRPYWHNWLKVEAENRAAPIDYVAGGLLAATSALLGNARWVSPWARWKEPAVLWLAEIPEESLASVQAHLRLVSRGGRLAEKRVGESLRPFLSLLLECLLSAAKRTFRPGIANVCQ